jgi:hypothetical protein
MKIAFALNAGSAVAAFVAAIFWFLSALGPLPTMQTYWGSAPSTDPLVHALNVSALMNRYAAGFSGLSALLFTAGILVGRRRSS